MEKRSLKNQNKYEENIRDLEKQISVLKAHINKQSSIINEFSKGSDYTILLPLEDDNALSISDSSITENAQPRLKLPLPTEPFHIKK